MNPSITFISNRLGIALMMILGATITFGSAQAQSSVKIDAPIGGGRHSDAVQKDFQQEVHYPAASVNALGRSAEATIRGHIEGQPKSPSRNGASGTEARQPATIVVNGVPMPLRVEADGRFSRPWAFGSGSQNVEVIAANGVRKRRQFYETQSGRVAPRLRVVLSWDSDNTDLDLHVVAPDGSHTFYADRVAANGGALDVDVTSGYGPEIFATPRPLSGIYHVFVNYYGSGDQGQDLTVAQVAILQNEGTPQEKQQVFRVPLRKPGELTPIRSFRIP